MMHLHSNSKKKHQFIEEIKENSSVVLKSSRLVKTNWVVLISEPTSVHDSDPFKYIKRKINSLFLFISWHFEFVVFISLTVVPHGLHRVLFSFVCFQMWNVLNYLCWFFFPIESWLCHRLGLGCVKFFVPSRDYTAVFWRYFQYNVIQSWETTIDTKILLLNISGSNKSLPDIFVLSLFIDYDQLYFMSYKSLLMNNFCCRFHHWN